MVPPQELQLRPPTVVPTERATLVHVGARVHARLGTLLDIYADRGLAGLWKGLFVSLVLVSNPAIQFAAYEQLKRTQVRGSRSRLGLCSRSPVRACVARAGRRACGLCGETLAGG